MTAFPWPVSQSLHHLSLHGSKHRTASFFLQSNIYKAQDYRIWRFMQSTHALMSSRKGSLKREKDKKKHKDNRKKDNSIHVNKRCWRGCIKIVCVNKRLLLCSISERREDMTQRLFSAHYSIITRPSIISGKIIKRSLS